MIVELNGKRIQLDENNPNDFGGEGNLYVHEGKMLKILHKPEQDRLKLSIGEALKVGLYDGIKDVATVPLEAIKEAKFIMPGIVGYTMELLDLRQYRKILDLMTSDYQMTAGHLRLKAITDAFAKLHQVISRVHAAGFRIGDLNNQNIFVAFSRSGVSIKLIDTSSWGFIGNDSVGAWKVSAIDPAIHHPKLPYEDKSGGQYYRRMLERDWFAYALHLAQALTGLSPFAAGSTLGDELTETERKQKGLHLWDHNVNVSQRKDQIACVRLGAKMVFLLKNWLNTGAKGPFPYGFLTQEFYGGLGNCPNCRMEVHKSCGRCPNCFACL